MECEFSKRDTGLTVASDTAAWHDRGVSHAPQPAESSRRRSLSLAPVTVALVLLCAVFPSCAVHHVGFEPRENTGSESPDGFPAATYPVPGESGAVSEVRVWSTGVARRQNGTGAVVTFGFEVENRSGEVLTLDASAVSVRGLTLAETGVVDAHLTGARVAGEPDTADGEVGVVALTFDLPDSVEPDDVRSFGLRWTFRGAGIPGGGYEQHTAFRRVPRRTPWPYSSPWMSPWHGPGFRSLHGPFWFRGRGGVHYCW